MIERFNADFVILTQASARQSLPPQLLRQTRIPDAQPPAPRFRDKCRAKTKSSVKGGLVARNFL